MPHRGEHFVLAYHWDHNCYLLHESLKARFAALEAELQGTREPDRATPKALLEHFSALQRLQERLAEHLAEMEKRCAVLQELGYRGYGTNKDLLGALEHLRREHAAAAEPLLRRRFTAAASRLPEGLQLPAGALERHDAKAVAAALRSRRRSAEPEPAPADTNREAFERYFAVMSKTPWNVNTTLFQKLFLQMGTASMTIMRGRTGYDSPRPPQELKAIGNRNFLEMYRESFASLHLFSEVGLDLLKRIHYVLSKELDPDAGNFRAYDFADRNGVTVDFGNLEREIGELGLVLGQTGQSFHDLPAFLWNLSRSYYMFIGIHPFRDSNGRVGRTFLNHMLLKKGIPPISFRNEDEVFALPRYGGSMEAMHAYLTGRILQAMEAYHRERAELEERGLLGREIFNVSFDSGFHFRQVNESPQKLEIACEAYVVPDGSEPAALLVDQCRVVLPSEKLVRAGGVYCGLADTERGEWRRTLGLQAPREIRELPAEMPGVRRFELTFVLEMDEAFLRHDWLYCSFVSPEDRRVFSNKGIYYGTRVEKRSFSALASEAAERWAQPAFKWIGERKMVRRAPEGEASCYPGGIGFSMLGGAAGLSLKVLLEVWRADGACERFLADAQTTGGFGGDWQKWETHRLPLFPWDGAHGHVTFVNFGYLVHRDGRAHVSQHTYKLANFADFTNGSTERDDFWDPSYKSENRYAVGQVDGAALQRAYDSVNASAAPLDTRVLFTRGDPGNPAHPVHEIHRAIDEVIERKKRDKKGRHFIHLAIFDFDNHHVAEHLIWARRQGVEVECIADWAAVSPVSPTENVARMRRAGIAVLGVVRNTPGAPEEGIGSMHTKFINFDGEVVHSSSYNLHFHLWGGNREETLVFRSPEVALLYENVFQAIRGGVVQPLTIDPAARVNLYYSFGFQKTKEGKLFRAQDALITEINHARESIQICMFDLGFLTGVSLADAHETDVVTALINARNRGVKVKVLLNGQIAHTGPLPASWDKDYPRPLKEAARRLKDAWVDVGFVYYWESVYSPLHHKFAAIDGQTCIIGSYNWYEASTISDEVLLVLRDAGLARALAEEAQQIERTLRVGRD